MANNQNLIKRTKDLNSSNDSEDGILKDVILTRRTTKVVKGGKKTSFSAMVVVGDKKGHLGLAMGKAGDVRTAIDKATKKAKKGMIKVAIDKNTITHEVNAKFGASKIMLRPAKRGTGIIASSVIRMMLELAGVQDIVSKMHGTSNRITNAYCVMKAVKQLKQPKVSRVAQVAQENTPNLSSK